MKTKNAKNVIVCLGFKIQIGFNERNLPIIYEQKLT